MRKINLEGYEVEVLDPATNEKKKLTYEVRKSICELLFIPQLKLNGPALIKQMDLSKKIEEAPENYVLMEEEEYRNVEKAFVLFEGFGAREVELVKRILNAEKVEVAPK